MHTDQLVSTAKAFREAFNVYKNKGQLNQKTFNKLSYDSALAIVNTFLNKASDYLKTNPNDAKYKSFVNYLYGEDSRVPNELLNTIIKWYFKETANKKPFNFNVSKDTISMKSVDKMRNGSPYKMVFYTKTMERFNAHPYDCYIPYLETVKFDNEVD